MAGSSQKGKKLDIGDKIAHRTKRIEDGALCLIPNCNLPMRAGNYCNKHYLRDYLNPKTEKRRKRKIAQELSHILGIPRDEAYKLISAVQIAMTNALRRGETVHIAGFGIFDIKRKPKRKRRSPVFFKPAKELRYMVNHPDWRPEC